MIQPTLSALFVPHLPPQRRGAGAPGPDAERRLEQALEQVVQRLNRSPPPLRPDPAQLLPYLAQRVPEGADLARCVGAVHVEDLALAWACAQGHAESIAELERQHFVVVDRALARIPDAAAQSEEVKQLLRQRLFVPRPSQPARVSLYRGRGALASWLRVAAIRCALNLVQRHGREVALSDELLGGLAAPVDQELAHLKRTYRGEFKRAFEQALTSLSSRQRNVLSYHYLERLTNDQVGAIYGVHRTTVARWMSGIREALAQRTRARLMTQLRVAGDEVESIMRLIRSELDASIERCLLASSDGEP